MMDCEYCPFIYECTRLMIDYQYDWCYFDDEEDDDEYDDDEDW